MRHGDGGQLELIPAIDLVGLGHSVFEDLLVALLAQHRTDVHDLGLAAGPRAGAREQDGEQEQTHGAGESGGVRTVASLRGVGTEGPAAAGGRHRGPGAASARRKRRGRR